MAEELSNKNWIFAIRRIATRVELDEFIILWSLLKDVSLSDEVSDSISWKWSPSWEFSTASAYSIQFQGSHQPSGNL
jgi:hypothetical protein